MIEPFSKSIPAWQHEHAKVLQCACQSLRASIAAGKPVGKAVRRKARSLDGRPYRCEPSRRIKLAAVTLRRWWGVWKRGGEIPAAFKFNFNPHRKFIPAPVLIRFAEFCASRPLPSLADAWRQFSARRGSFGHGRRAARPQQISYFVLSQYFPAAVFYQLQAELKAIHTAQMNLGKLKLKAIADIRARLPDRPPRRRMKRGNTFEI